MTAEYSTKHGGLKSMKPNVLHRTHTHEASSAKYLLDGSPERKFSMRRALGKDEANESMWSTYIIKA